MQLTQREFGNLFGVNRKTVERWESGEITVTRDRFNEMVKSLKEQENRTIE